MQSIVEALKKYWGYGEFRPLQKEAMQCVREGCDSVVVLPTGGGKSLCFQAPAVTMPGMALVVSPLISLMKDQVDALRQCGIQAARLDSFQSPQERTLVFDQIENRSLKLLYLSPERLFSNGFIDYLKKNDVSFAAIDEAHCVSMWGHDFRPEYRMLGQLKTALPGVALHAYTATATAQVRDDISTQLNLSKPQVLVGSFDRPNLVYKIERAKDIFKQVCSTIDRHANESGIVYCIRRGDVDSMCAQLIRKGYKVLPYHAGMTDSDRKQNQDAFIQEKVNTIVATVAFGMGIDKSNVRYVIHTGMPKSLEHYQQESGRAGRDGLEAECILFYSGSDYGTWRSILGKSTEEFQKIALRKLSDMYDYCTGVNCRHRAILRYFGQDLGKSNCAACDVCLEGLECIQDPLITAQKILSCVVRLEQRFGAEYTSLVLTGSKEQRILNCKHNELSTYGLLSDFDKRVVRDWVEQLVSQGYLQKTGDYNVLAVTETGWRVIRGAEKPRLLQPARKPVKASKAAQESWEGVDRALFDVLREVRRKIAEENNVPSFVVFSDASLREMARHIPVTLKQFRRIHGVGESKCHKYGKRFLSAIQQAYPDKFLYSEPEPDEIPDIERAYHPWSEGEDERLKQYVREGKSLREIAHRLQRNRGAIRSRKKKLGLTHDDQDPLADTSLNLTQSQAFRMFEERKSVEEVIAATGRKSSTVYKYLNDYLSQNKIVDPTPWIDPQDCKRILEAAAQIDTERLRPIYDLLNEEIPYDKIRIVLTCAGNIA